MAEVVFQPIFNGNNWKKAKKIKDISKMLIYF